MSSLSKEYINRVKTGPFKIKEMKNPGLVSMTFLHKLLYLVHARDVMKVIQMHGLFPQPSEMLESTSPDLELIYKVKIQGSRDLELKEGVGEIFDAMGRNKFIKIQNHITRTICKTSNQHDVENSLLPYFLTMAACNLAESHLQHQCPENGIPMFKKGSIIGPTNSATDRDNELNNLILRTEHADDDEWDEYRVKRLADLETIDRDEHGGILNICIAAKGCFRPINDTLTNTTEHSEHIEFLNRFTLDVDDANYEVLLEMNRELREKPKPRKRGKKSKKGAEDDDEEDEAEEVESPSAKTPNTARTSGSDTGTGGFEAFSESGGSGTRRSRRSRTRVKTYDEGGTDDGGSEGEDDDDEFFRASPPAAKRLRYNHSGPRSLSPPQTLLRAAQAQAMADFMRVLQQDPAHNALTGPVIQLWESTLGNYSPNKKKRVVTSFADIEKAAIDLTKDDDNSGEDLEEPPAVKQCTRDEIIKKFSQINFNHKNPTDLSSKPDIDTINETLGINAPGMAKPHHIRYKDQFVFVVMSRDLCHSVWSKYKGEDGKPLNKTAGIIYDTLLDYSAKGWKVSLFINTTEPGDLVVLVKNETYDHLRNNKLAKVYKTDGGSSGSDEGSDDADSAKDDGEGSNQNESGDEKGESSESRDDDDGQKENPPEGELVDKMDIEIDSGVACKSGEGGDEGVPGHKMDGASQSTQAEPTSPRLQQPATEPTSPSRQEHAPEAETANADETEEPKAPEKDDQDANENKDADVPSETTNGDDEAHRDDDEHQSHAGGLNESADASADHQAPSPEGDGASHARTRRSKSPQRNSNQQMKIPLEENPVVQPVTPRAAKKRKGPPENQGTPSPTRRSGRTHKKRDLSC